MTLLHNCLEYLTLTDRSLHSEVKYFCIMAAKLHCPSAQPISDVTLLPLQLRLNIQTKIDIPCPFIHLSGKELFNKKVNEQPAGH